MDKYKRLNIQIQRGTQYIIVANLKWTILNV